jgi:16S rRNA (adenine1518-N6/adenine1519-N6)-dimethyltransferase
MNFPRKRFGQHFLCDQTIIQRIVAALHPQPREHLIEIGPGQGALTLPVIKKIKYLEVIELDRDLIPVLEDRVQHAGEIKIFNEDVLEFDFAKIKNDARLLRVFGNLPYNISTPLIFHLLNYAAIISDMLFMLQKEVARRLAAKPSTPDYGRLSVMLQYHCQTELLFDVPAHAFYPPPRVQSSIVRLIPHRTYPFLAKNPKLFADIVKHAFGQRRKTLRNSLKELVTDEVWEQVQIHSDLRAENLSVKDFVEISNALS